MRKLKLKTSALASISKDDLSSPAVERNNQHEQDMLSKHRDSSQTIPLMSKFVTYGELLHSFRGQQCKNRGLFYVNDAKCSEPRPVKRKSASVQYASNLKLWFDLEQVKMLVERKKVSEEVENLLLLNQDMYEKDLNASFRGVFKLDSKKSIKVINFLLHSEEDSIDQSSLFHWGVIQHLINVSKQTADNDYFVVDIVLQERSRQLLADMLLESTVWFDSTNGQALCSHLDDGLSFPSINSLSKQLALTLAPHKGEVKVVKYFAIALNSSTESSSPILLANRDEMIAILWLNEAPAEWSSDNDGVLVYDTRTSDCLYGQGASRYPSIHPDFLSKGGDLNVNVASKCVNHQYEFIPRKKNRMLFVRSKAPVVFKVNESPNSRSTNSLEESISLAIVIVFNIKTKD